MTPSYLTLARREVVAASDLSGTPNQPGGYTAILDQPLNALAFTDAGVTWLNGGGWPTPDNGSVEIITDAGAPESPSNVLRWNYPIGYDSADSPAYRELVFGEGYSALYTCLWMRPSVGWENHPASINKLWYWTAQNTPGFTGTSFLNLRFSSGVPARFDFITQNPGSDQVVYTSSGFTPVLGEWHRIEVLQERTSGINGRVRVWAANESTPSAVLCIDEAGVVLTDAEQSVVSWVGAVANPYWGGNAGVATQAFSLDLDNITISGVPE
jgi:hypothetical protein